MEARTTAPLPCVALVMAAMMVFPCIQPSAHAQSTDSRVIAVIDVSADTRDHHGIAHDVNLALRRKSAWIVKDLNTVLNEGEEAEDQSNIKNAENMANAGQAALDDGDVREAARQLEASVSAMAQSFAYLPEFKRYRRALLMLGSAHLRAGDRDAAKEAFWRAANQGASADEVPLDDVSTALLQEVLGEHELAALGAVEVSTDPPHAEIYVNGRFKGISPTTVAGLSVGEHIVTLFKHGWVRTTSKMRVTSDAIEATSFRLEPARKRLILTQMQTALQSEVDTALGESGLGGDGVRDVAGLLFSETALVIRSSGPGDLKKVELFLFDSRTRRLINHVESTIDWTYRNRKAVRALVDRVLDFDLVEALGGDVTQVSRDGDDESVLNAWWLWTIVGVVVAGGVAAGVYFGTVSEPESPFAKDGAGAVVISF